MIIPDTVTIGGHVFSIKKVRRIYWRQPHVTGLIDHDRKLIKLKMSNKDPRILEQILFHEIAHGILGDLRYNYLKISRFMMDENFVEEMGLLLRQIFVGLLEKQRTGNP